MLKSFYSINKNIKDGNILLCMFDFSLDDINYIFSFLNIVYDIIFLYNFLIFLCFQNENKNSESMYLFKYNLYVESGNY